ncbi:uncharacterized protein LOC118814936 isoform X2 [Colossoma macropomum]|uniref:uncharacterized protein LOC118814936 isoform X2 n=1 Tax=Colossoma macropomum TaxID=42526 RepID=UPI001863FDBC|nr:uncharacterized protein LOC118814936 isoform X2 [Colossoma macropomum]
MVRMEDPEFGESKAGNPIQVREENQPGTSTAPQQTEREQKGVDGETGTDAYDWTTIQHVHNRFKHRDQQPKENIPESERKQDLEESKRLYQEQMCIWTIPMEAREDQNIKTDSSPKNQPGGQDTILPGGQKNVQPKGQDKIQTDNVQPGGQKCEHPYGQENGEVSLWAEKQVEGQEDEVISSDTINREKSEGNDTVNTESPGTFFQMRLGRDQLW